MQDHNNYSEECNCCNGEYMFKARVCSIKYICYSSEWRIGAVVVVIEIGVCNKEWNILECKKALNVDRE